MQPEQTTTGDGPDAGAVLRFLTANPEFFDQHQDVLPRLRIPHVSGRAVSLIERQVSVLRGKCSSLENHLRDLIGVAHANERLQGRLHALVEEIISADSLDAVVAATRESLAESFGADAVHVLLVGVPDGQGHRGLDPDDARLAPFAELLEAGGTRCGMPSDAELEALVGDARADIGSAALIPLRHEGWIGIVMLSSRDESRFAAGKGVVFLDQLGGVLSRRVHAFRRAAPPSLAPPTPGHPTAVRPDVELAGAEPSGSGPGGARSPRRPDIELASTDPADVGRACADRATPA